MAVDSVMRYTSIILAVGACAPVAAQQATQPPNSADRSAVAIWIGVSWQTPQLWGALQDRETFLFGIQWHYALHRSDALVVSYVAEALPSVVVSETPWPIPRSEFCPTRYSCVRGASAIPALTGNSENRIYGVGLAPLGFEFAVRPAGPVEVVTGIAGGLVRFFGDLHADGARLNLSASVMAGIRWNLGRRIALTGGYRYFHLSNAGMGMANPGLDASVWRLGLLVR